MNVLQTIYLCLQFNERMKFLNFCLFSALGPLNSQKPKIVVRLDTVVVVFGLVVGGSQLGQLV